MKFLFVSYDGLTDPLGQSQITPYVVGLKQKGLDYSIFSVEKKSALEENETLVKGTLFDQSIDWTFISYTKKPAFLSSIYDVLRIRSSVKREVIKQNITHLHCRSYVAMYAVFPLIKKFNLKVVFDMRGFWIDERIEGGIWNNANPLIRLLVTYLKKCEKKWFEKADLIISLTDEGKSTISSICPKVKPTNIAVIPCCADEFLFNPSTIKNEEISAFKNELGVGENQKVLGYIGSFGTWYLSSEMMQSFKYLNEQQLVDKFLILSKEDPKIIEEIALNNGIKKENLVIISANRNDVPKLLSIIDLGIFYIKPSFSKTASSPTKLGELLLMGKAVICNKGVGDLDYYFDTNNVGMCIDIKNASRIDITDFNKVMSIESSAIREAGLAAFSLKSGIDKYYVELSKLK